MGAVYSRIRRAASFRARTRKPVVLLSRSHNAPPAGAAGRSRGGRGMGSRYAGAPSGTTVNPEPGTRFFGYLSPRQISSSAGFDQTSFGLLARLKRFELLTPKIRSLSVRFCLQRGRLVARHNVLVCFVVTRFTDRVL